MLKTVVLYQKIESYFRASRTLSADGAISHYLLLTRVVVTTYLSPSPSWSHQLFKKSMYFHIALN